ncbi:hypothetical protein EGR_00754 [Echinococcus granulosus]|uniref:Uncharacterized protein n=1 Tax=Echinococcus granulosus TaxID=6210 RepID=W6UR59_ECHGR|nr:hypothetical protein EGR_00754 [Echinococcus granulosus]EUB64210.1 hypothetical protein EGR_00754 [Echinococcus granulosus]
MVPDKFVLDILDLNTSRYTDISIANGFSERDAHLYTCRDYLLQPTLLDSDLKGSDLKYCAIPCKASRRKRPHPIGLENKGAHPLTSPNSSLVGAMVLRYAEVVQVHTSPRACPEDVLSRLIKWNARMSTLDNATSRCATEQAAVARGVTV